MMSQTTNPTDYVQAMALKEAGNNAFRAAEYQLALKNYSQIFIYVGMNRPMNMASMMGAKPSPRKPASSRDPMEQKMGELRLTAFSNMAAVYFKMGKWRECKAKCTRVLEDDDQNVKALYYRGMAHRRMKLVKSAKSDFQIAQKLIRDESNPMHQAIEREMNLLSSWMS